MRKEGKHHDPFGTDAGVEDASEHHGDWKTEEPHLVYESQLSGGKVERFAELRQYAGSYAKRESSGDECKTTSIKESFAVVIVHISNVSLAKYTCFFEFRYHEQSEFSLPVAVLGRLCAVAKNMIPRRRSNCRKRSNGEISKRIAIVIFSERLNILFT